MSVSPGGHSSGSGGPGRTDEFGLRSVDEPIPVRNVHATILDPPGLDDDKLRYLHAGRLPRRNDIGGKVLDEIIA